MGATEEQMQLLSDAGVMHVSYILILYSMAFFVFLCKLSYSFYSALSSPDPILTHLVVNVLLHIYAVHVWPETATTGDSRHPRKAGLSKTRRGRGRAHRNGNGTAATSGESMMNGHVRTPSETQRVQDAEAFELEGLMSDEGEDVLDVDGNRRDEENIPLVGRGDVDSDAVEIKDFEERR